MKRPTILEMHSGIKLRSGAVSVMSLAAAFGLLSVEASAVSTRVKLACAKDYYAHCSKHAPGSPEVRACMRAVGDGLSARCVNALAAEGELSAKEMARVAKNDN